MACENYALKGLAKTCDANVGGIKEVYIAVAEDVTAITGDYISGTTANTINEMEIVTGISMSTGKKFHKYYFRKNTGSMTKTLNVTDEGGNYISTELSLRFSRMETPKRVEMRALSLNDMVVIVRDANDQYWLLGTPDDPVVASAGGGETGTNREDSNAYTITLSSETNYWPLPVDSSIISELVA